MGKIIDFWRENWKWFYMAFIFSLLFYLFIFGIPSSEDVRENTLALYSNFSEDGFHNENLCVSRGPNVIGCPWNMSDKTCIDSGRCDAWVTIWVRDDCTLSKWDEVLC